ncbi:protein PHLOEM protein 2-LIKE A10 [Canna indica]|uniref:Protein PHLOEM protein 2-LIKE A10 n=1 Tax=Canna indica TaxID=4628 RepID=A0AAQ3JMD7_9LILI|nr:protein PHLOEM protein 2-LIKE A10 [Canna indica]
MPFFGASASVSVRFGRWWLLLLLLSAASGVSGYGAYQLYHLPSVARRRRALAKLVRALISVAEVASSSADVLNLVSADLNRFLRSDSDDVPTSLQQIAKLARSEEFRASISRASEAVSTGIVRGVSSATASVREVESCDSELRVVSSTFFLDRFLYKLLSPTGSGFAAAVVGSFARNLASTFSSVESRGKSHEDGVPRWLVRICGDNKCRELIVDSIERVVSTAVSSYLDRTTKTNAFDEFFSSLTNPKHEAKVKNILVSVCNGAVATMVKTSRSRRAMMSSISTRQVEVKQLKEGGDGLISGAVLSTLAIPSNRRLLVNVTGRVTIETMRSFLDFLQWKLFATARTGVDVIHGDVTKRGLEMVRFVSAKSMVILAVCLALCMQIYTGRRLMN